MKQKPLTLYMHITLSSKISRLLLMFCVCDCACVSAYAKLRKGSDSIWLIEVRAEYFDKCKYGFTI